MCVFASSYSWAERCQLAWVEGGWISTVAGPASPAWCIGSQDLMDPCEINGSHAPFLRSLTYVFQAAIKSLDGNRGPI